MIRQEGRYLVDMDELEAGGCSAWVGDGRCGDLRASANGVQMGQQSLRRYCHTTLEVYFDEGDPPMYLAVLCGRHSGGWGSLTQDMAPSRMSQVMQALGGEDAARGAPA